MMIVTPDIETIRKTRWSMYKETWGLVPTMGYLHEGHLSLVRLARAANDRVAVSIFVNPTQFAPTEDLATYPRNLERDLRLLKTEKVDLVFIPSNQSMYPPDFQTKVTVEKISMPLEGSSRPSHFQGVSTVVAKLFNIFEPTRAYFGQKDFQQTLLIKQMIKDLNFGIEIVIGRIVREADGLAMSSRNKRLNPEQRQAASLLYNTLVLTEKAFIAGETSGHRLREFISTNIAKEPLARLDYASVADATNLAEVDEITGPTLLSLAVFFDSVRLIDNLILNPEN